MDNTRDVNVASEKTEIVSARIEPSFRKRLEAVQLERGDRALSHTLYALLRDGVDLHDQQRRRAA